MSSDANVPPQAGETATATIGLRIAGQPIRLTITVPAGPTTVRQLLPELNTLTDIMVDVGVRNANEQGYQVSCRKGCGACCRQIVPVSGSEARALARLVEAMPEPRRSQVRARFAEALGRLEQAGLGDGLRAPERIPDGDRRAFGLDYFRAGVPCPFLEEESCSIHTDRPIACREYLVASPAENCASPSAASIQVIRVPAEVGAVVRAMDMQACGSASSWVPLVAALEWAAEHPEDPAPRPGPALLEDIFRRLRRESAD